MEKRIQNLIWVMIGLVATVAAVSIIISLLYGGSYANGTYGPIGMMGYGYYGMGIVMPIIGIISVVFVLIFIYFIFEAARQPERSYYPRYETTPEEIAKERLAKGEITEEQYARIIENLRK